MKKRNIAFILAIITLFAYSYAFATTTESKTSVKWVLDQYVDDFGRKTGDNIVHNEELIAGTFSNSAVQNALLGVCVVADTEDIYLILYEYGRSMVTNPLSQDIYYYDVAILDAYNKIHTLNGAISPGDFRLYFDENETIIEAIKTGSISFAITKSDRKTNRYNFKIEKTKEFVDLYSQINGK